MADERVQKLRRKLDEARDAGDEQRVQKFARKLAEAAPEPEPPVAVEPVEENARVAKARRKLERAQQRGADADEVAKRRAKLQRLLGESAVEESDEAQEARLSASHQNGKRNPRPEIAAFADDHLTTGEVRDVLSFLLLLLILSVLVLVPRSHLLVGRLAWRRFKS